MIISAVGDFEQAIN